MVILAFSAVILMQLLAVATLGCLQYLVPELQAVVVLLRLCQTQ